ncbi:MAG TPA: AAA family ATPase [Longimicrobiaceae bacterium]
MSSRDHSTELEQPQRWLSEVRLERFKAAFSPPSIPLQPFNVVIGRNGSGKSTLLEALQWIATAIRRDAREASERYYGIQDLVNLRARGLKYFQITLTWSSTIPEEQRVRYTIRVEEQGGTSVIRSEQLSIINESGRVIRPFIRTAAEGDRIVYASPQPGAPQLHVRDPDRLALVLAWGTQMAAEHPWLSYLEEFWARAVFLRLSPNRLAAGSPATRKSFEPLLDEEGQMLPALLNELDEDQSRSLVVSIQDMLQGIEGVTVSKADLGRDTRVNYSLLERMPYQGRAGRRQFPIPSWMLSEGTRRITAILALLARHPAPTLLCIEEIENGLDPWTTIRMLTYLESASDEGVQLVISTHSPWLLDHVPLQSIIQVRRTDGDTKYERFSEREEIRAFQANIPPGTRYTSEGH